MKSIAKTVFAGAAAALLLWGCQKEAAEDEDAPYRLNPGLAKIDSVPLGAKVFLNGVDFGRTPVIRPAPPKKRVDLEIRGPAGTVHTSVLERDASGNFAIEVDMRPLLKTATPRPPPTARRSAPPTSSGELWMGGREEKKPKTTPFTYQPPPKLTGAQRLNRAVNRRKADRLDRNTKPADVANRQACYKSWQSCTGRCGGSGSITRNRYMECRKSCRRSYDSCRSRF